MGPSNPGTGANKMSPNPEGGAKMKCSKMGGRENKMASILAARAGMTSSN